MVAYINVEIFTTFVKEGGIDKSLLYFYDSGRYIDNLYKNNKQAIKDVLQWSVNMDFTKVYDEVVVSSDGDLSAIELSTEGSIERDIIDGQTRRSAKSFLGVQRSDVPTFTFRKNITIKSDSVNNKDLADQIYRELLSNAFTIGCEVVSPFIDINEPSKGLWQLGAEINIENAEILNYLKLIKNNNGVFFTLVNKFVLIGVSHSIQNETLITKLTITPSRFVRTVF